MLPKREFTQKIALWKTGLNELRIIVDQSKPTAPTCLIMEDAASKG
jgi:hypothetical protein